MTDEEKLMLSMMYQAIQTCAAKVNELVQGHNAMITRLAELKEQLELRANFGQDGVN